MMVDKTGVGPGPGPGPGGGDAGSGGSNSSGADQQGACNSSGSCSHSGSGSSGQRSLVNSRDEDGAEEAAEAGAGRGAAVGRGGGDGASPEKSPALRTKSNQRWMKLRTTVQLSGAITSSIQKTKPPLKREDSFLKRFSTRQIAEAQETLDTGDDGEGGSCSSSGGGAGGCAEAGRRRRRRRRRRQQLSRTVVNPDENFYFYWLMLLTVCVLYNVWTLIVRQSFPELQNMATGLWYAADGFTDVVFLLDVVVQFRTGYLEQGLMVYDSSKLAGHYVTSRAFLLDLATLVPLDLLQFNLGPNPILRFPRFFKAYRVYHYYYMVESRTVYPNLWRVVNLIHILLVLAHWFGCFYFLLSQHEKFQGDWVYPYRPGEYSTLTRKYLGSLYWSTLTLTTIGDLPTPETNADLRKSFTDGPQNMRRRGHKSRLLQFSTNGGYIFTIVSYLIGVFIFATIVGQVGNVITNRNANRLEFERLLDGAKTYMRHHKVPGGMKRRVLRWYDYSWSRGRIQGGGDINTALGLLPDKLKTELALHVNLSVLKKVTIFQECQPEFLHDLVLKMKAYIFTPGDLICRKGEVAREMFIIADGILEVISETGRVLTTMKAGDFFGEIGILNLDGLNKRTADVRSVGYSELFSLSREDVLAAMKDYPEAQEILQSLGRKRLMEARHVSRSNKEQGRHHHSSHQARDRDPCPPVEASDARGKRIVERLRSDVKQGLKNALRKGRRGTKGMDDESMELQPLTKGTAGKGVLRRMPRVRSDDLSVDESSEEQGGPGPGPAQSEQGVPIIQRLLMLKAKQERDDQEEMSGDSANGQHLLQKLRNLKSTRQQPQPQQHVAGPGPGEASPPREVIGAGLPLLQRLLLLKAKEDRERLASEALLQSSCTARAQGSPPPPPGAGLKRSRGSVKRGHDVVAPSSATSGDSDEGVGKKSSILKRIVSIKKKGPSETAMTGSVSSVTPSASSGTIKGHMASANTSLGSDDVAEEKLAQEEAPAAPAPPQVQSKGTILKEKLKTVLHHTSAASSSGTGQAKQTWGLLRKATVSKHHSKTRTPAIKVEGAQEVTPAPIPPPAAEEVPPSVARRVTSPPALKPLGLSGPSLSNVGEEEEEEEPASTAQPATTAAAPTTHVTTTRKPNLLRFHPGSKLYRSIDDLSPEYCGLPFVKRLKILNERQKLAELEANVRSSSLDSGGVEQGDEPQCLTRSHSETCAMEQARARHSKQRAAQRQQLEQRMQQQQPPERPAALSSSGAPLPAAEPSQGVASPESNETAERRNLKSILKKLSSSSLFESKSTGGSAGSDDSVPSPAVVPPAELRKLMRAPTVEGYAARHSKLTKSVTFNRDTLQSPPSSASTPTLPATQAPSKVVGGTTVFFPSPNRMARKLYSSCDSPAQSDAPVAPVPCDPPPIPVSISITCAVAKVTLEGELPLKPPVTEISDHKPYVTIVSTTVYSITSASVRTVAPSSDFLHQTSVVAKAEMRSELISVQSGEGRPIASPHLPPGDGLDPIPSGDSARQLHDAPITLDLAAVESSEPAATTSAATFTPVTTTVTVVSSTTPFPTPPTLPRTSIVIPPITEKRKQVPFIVQGIQPKPIPTSQKNFFRPEAFLRNFREEEHFSDILVGIKHVIQGHMEDLQREFQLQCQSLELEVKKRDDIISKLQHRIQELENPQLDEESSEGPDMCDIPDAPFMRGDSVDTVLFSPPRTPPGDDEEAEDEEEEEDVDITDHRMEDNEDHEDDDDNANVLASSRSPRNHSVRPRDADDTETSADEEAAPTSRRSSARQVLHRRSWEDQSQEPQALWSGVNGGSRETGDSVVLDIGTSSDASSNEEDQFDEEAGSGGLFVRDDDDDDSLHFRGHQGDWEVQMLARELERREEQNRLQEEVRVLQQAVNDNTCTLDDLSNSQLDLLERVLTSSTIMRRSAGSVSLSDRRPLFRRGGSLEEPDVIAQAPVLPSTSASALYRRRSFRQQSLMSRSSISSNGKPDSSRSGYGPSRVQGRLSRGSSSTSSSLENAMHRVGIPHQCSSPFRQPRASSRKQQLLNARSLEEHRDHLPEQPGAAPGPGPGLQRLASRSTSHLPHSSFPSSLVRGLGQLVRGHYHHHHLQLQDAPSPAGPCPSAAAGTSSTSPTGSSPAVATISQGLVTPPDTAFPLPPPQPPPDL